jgi:hypothetical protein
MATNAILGAGSSLKLGDGASPEVFTKIAEVLRVGAIGQSAAEIDVTSLDSTAKEYIAALPDGETVSITMNFVGGTQQNALRDGVRTTKNFVMEFSDNTKATFSMVILGFLRDETSPESQLTASVNGRITGPITWGVYT